MRWSYLIYRTTVHQSNQSLRNTELSPLKAQQKKKRNLTLPSLLYQAVFLSLCSSLPISCSFSFCRYVLLLFALCLSLSFSLSLFLSLSQPLLSVPPLSLSYSLSLFFFLSQLLLS